MGVNERITRILDIHFDYGYREPMADVMVVDRLSDKLGDGGVEKRKYIVAGDLS